MSILLDQAFDAAFDAPDERDFRFGNVITKKVNVPDEILPDYKTPVLNQGRTMRCTLFSVSQGINEQNYEEAKRIGVSQYKTLNGTEYIPDAIRDFDYSEEKGGFVQNALKLYRDKGEYEGYVRIEGVDEYRQAIASGRKVCTGSNKIDWSKTQKVAVRGRGYGHAFPGLYYTREGALIKNSIGDKAHDRGYFLVRWEDFDTLFTMYAIIDKSDAHILWGYRAIQERLTTQSIEQFRGDFVATRREAAIFTSRKYGVPEVKIWNASNPNAPVTAHEFSIMRNRCDKKVMIVPDTLLLKRWEIIKTLIKSK